MKKVYINGYFTKEYINGVPRYAMEIVKRLDQYFKSGEAELVVPKNAVNIPRLNNIKVCTWEDRGCPREIDNVLWGSISYRNYLKKVKGLNVNLTNRAEWVRNSITAFHDMIQVENIRYSFVKENVQVRLKRILGNLWFHYKLFVKKYTATVIVTVSEYSKRELQDKGGVKAEKIEVISSGWDHINDIEEYDEKLDQHIVKDGYFLFVGNIRPHKNIKWIIQEATFMPDEYFVIAGKIPDEIITQLKIVRSNCIFLGHVSDEYLKYLMRNCKALLFPSYVEGFGLPPLEVLALGGKAIVADIPIMHEVYKNCVYYINPHQGDVDLNALLTNSVEEPNEILQQYTWDRAAKRWFELIKEVREKL